MKVSEEVVKAISCTEVVEIEAEIDKLFERVRNKYSPKIPGRREFRKCGVKESELLLGIEEALFEIKNIPRSNLEKYAHLNKYIYFSVYSQIRDKGWILIPTDTKYRYKMHNPNKNFNRKKAVSNTFLQIVSADESINCYLPLKEDRCVFAISDGSSFVLATGRPFLSSKELISSYEYFTRI